MKKTQRKHQAITATKDRQRLSTSNREHAPVLTFSSYAWLKLQFLCHIGDTEVGAFGITSQQNLLYVEDVVTVQQHCTCVSVEFNDEAVADFFDEQVEVGRVPEQFARIWLHTHPGDSPTPSGVDEETFTRVFGRCHWSVMFILARGGQTHCRLRVGAVNDGSGLAIASPIPVEVNYGTLTEVGFNTPIAGWLQEHETNVVEDPDLWSGTFSHTDTPAIAKEKDEFDADAWMACYEELDHLEQQSILDELGMRLPPAEEVANED